MSMPVKKFWKSVIRVTSFPVRCTERRQPFSADNLFKLVISLQSLGTGKLVTKTIYDRVSGFTDNYVISY